MPFDGTNFGSSGPNNKALLVTPSAFLGSQWMAAAQSVFAERLKVSPHQVHPIAAQEVTKGHLQNHKNVMLAGLALALRDKVLEAGVFKKEEIVEMAVQSQKSLTHFGQFILPRIVKEYVCERPFEVTLITERGTYIYSRSDPALSDRKTLTIGKIYLTASIG